MSALRPLPPRPSLEFEHKEAKALLRRLRARDPEALARARARHPALPAATPERIRLADAQLVIAREYGFPSWPRLVRYFGDVDRQRHNDYRSARPDRRDSCDARVRGLLAQHRERGAWAGRALASYVPRFYGMRVEDIFAATITEDEARLAVARTYGVPSWEVLLERMTADVRATPVGDWDVDPLAYAAKAMEAADLGELKRVVGEHPDLLHPPDERVAKGGSLLRVAIHHERRQGVAAMRPIIEWLGTQGLDYQLELNRQLCGHLHMKTEKVRWLLDRGADPDWIAPNGIPVLEHALIRYWNGEAVDLLGTRAVPGRALWIAAGLGDVDGVRRSLDAQGKPTPSARRLRPDFDAVGPMNQPSHPDPGDEEILMEAFFVALLNGRTAVLEYMVSRGFPVDSLVWGKPVLHIAVGNAMTPMVECLVRCGADPDLRAGRRHGESARELARGFFENAPQDAGRRRIVELCGMDPDAILAERDARLVTPPVVEPELQQALELAGDDALRLGQSDIRPENLLFGLLRSGGLPVLYFNKVSRMDLDRFRADVETRVRPGEGRVEGPTLPMDADARAAVQAATALATARRRETVNGLHLLAALTRAGGAAADLLAGYGSSAAELNERLERAL